MGDDSSTPRDAGKDSGADSGQDTGVPDSGNDAGGNDGAVVDPCNGVPASGICGANNTVQYCSVPTGQGTASVVTVSCASFEQCTVDPKGTASCTPLPSNCIPGESTCTGTNIENYCDTTGHWISSTCTACTTSPLGALCPGTISTTSWSGTLMYEARGPNSTTSPTDWQTTATAVAAQGVLVVSYVYDSTSQSYTPIAATTTDSAGAFTIQTPTSPGSNDEIVFWPVHTRPNSANVGYAVADPGTGSGQQPTNFDPSKSKLWSWSELDSALGASGGTVTITEANFSGPMRVFDWLRYAFDSIESVIGSPGKPLVLWVGQDTGWTCGSCEMTQPVTAASIRFGAQIFISAYNLTQEYYADPVTVHELGHWVMGSYGTMPNEGGKHYYDCPTYPGQAWAEGWATWFSTLARTNSLYYDKQMTGPNSTVFFWFDVGSRTFSSGGPWPRPSPTDPAGVLQMLDENEVSAMLWSMTTQTQPALTNTNNTVFFTALQSAIINKASAAYGQGYTRHTWDLGSGCSKTNVVDTQISAPAFPDFLDALDCGGFPTASIDSATQPFTYYPFQSSTPICQ